MNKKTVWLWIVAALVSILLGVPLLRNGVGRYYHSLFAVWGASFIVMNLYVTGFRLGRVLARRGRKNYFRSALLSMGIAWALSVGVLFVANLTPLCVGQDNGDGVDTVGQCVVYTVLWGGIYSVKAVIVIAIAAALLDRLLRSRDRMSAQSPH
jgi:hypothetical protein